MSTTTHRHALACAAFAAFLPLHAQAQATRLVPSQYPTIQSAIDASAHGDAIKVAAGVYVENINFHGRNVMVVSEAGPATTVIDGARRGATVTFESQETAMAVLEGFTIRNGLAYFGAGMVVNGSAPTIVGNVFEQNVHYSGGYGAAIGANGGSPIVERNLFRGNGCDAQWTAGVVSFVNGSSPWIFNNVFIDNPTCMAINMTLPVGNTPRVFNNTIVGNRGGVHVDARISAVQQVFRNNLIAANQIGLELVFNPGGNEPTWTNNLVHGNATDYLGIAPQTGANGNLSADPLLKNAAAGDVHLLAGSPAIDAGVSTPAGFPEQDFEGDTRIVDGNGDLAAQVDIGADEFKPVSAPATVPFANLRAWLHILRQRGRKADRFTGSGVFELGAGSNGVQPLVEPLTIRLADADGVFFEQTLPAGALLRNGPRAYRFESRAGQGGVDRVVLRQLEGSGRFAIDVSGSRVDLSGASRAGLSVSLSLGDDGGSDTLACHPARGVIACR